MSQSEQHKKLVELTADKLKNRYSEIVIVVDLQSVPGDEVPPLIEGFRPDIYAHNKQSKLVVIGEAKTDNDIDTKHTYVQVRSFLNHLECRLNGNFVLAVTGIGSDRAKTFLRFIHKELNLQKTSIEVFDCCDFWRLDSHNGIKWHLKLRKAPKLSAKLEAYPYQLDAVRAVKSLPYAAIFHEQGLGKTKIAIDLILFWLEEDIVDTVFIITKKILVRNWFNEVLFHSHIMPKILSDNRQENSIALNSPILIYIMNYETVSANFGIIYPFS